MPADYLQFAGLVLAAASLLISGLAPRFMEFTIPHDDFGRRARLIVSVCRAARQESLRLGIVEVIDEPELAAAPEGDLASYVRLDSDAIGTEVSAKRLVTLERATRLVIVVDVVFAVVIAAISLLQPQFREAWGVAAGLTLATMIAAYVWLYCLCSQLEVLEEAIRAYEFAQ